MDIYTHSLSATIKRTEAKEIIGNMADKNCKINEIYCSKGGKLEFIDLEGMGEPLLDGERD